MQFLLKWIEQLFKKKFQISGSSSKSVSKTNKGAQKETTA
jgi:hypothetical protein